MLGILLLIVVTILFVHIVGVAVAIVYSHHDYRCWYDHQCTSTTTTIINTNRICCGIFCCICHSISQLSTTTNTTKRNHYQNCMGVDYVYDKMNNQGRLVQNDQHQHHYQNCGVIVDYVDDEMSDQGRLVVILFIKTQKCLANILSRIPFKFCFCFLGILRVLEDIRKSKNKLKHDTLRYLEAHILWNGVHTCTCQSTVKIDMFLFYTKFNPKCKNLY